MANKRGAKSDATGGRTPAGFERIEFAALRLPLRVPAAFVGLRFHHSLCHADAPSAPVGTRKLLVECRCCQLKWEPGAHEHLIWCGFRDLAAACAFIERSIELCGRTRVVPSAGAQRTRYDVLLKFGDVELSTVHREFRPG